MSAQPHRYKPLAERFWRRVVKTEMCWEYTGDMAQRYPRIHVQGKYLKCSRVSYEMHNGAIATGLLVCHRCDNPRCVRPEHLFLGTAKDNMQDMKAKGRGAKQRRQHCVHGHEYTPENTRTVRGHRACRTCLTAQARAYKQNNHELVKARKRVGYKKQQAKEHGIDTATVFTSRSFSGNK